MKYNENRAIDMVEEEDGTLLYVAPSIYDDCILADGTPFRDLFRRCCIDYGKDHLSTTDEYNSENNDDSEDFFEYHWRRTPHSDLSECLNFVSGNSAAELLISEDGQFQALLWLDGDMRDCNTVLLAAKVATGQKITLGNVQQFLHETYEMLGIPRCNKKIPDALPLSYVEDIKQHYNDQKFYVEALSGRMTAPDITLKAHDGSFRVRIQMKHIDNREYRKTVDKLFERLGGETLHDEGVAHIDVDEWDEWYIEEEWLTVNPPEVRTASIRMDDDFFFDPVTPWWTSEGLNFVLSYVYTVGSTAGTKNADAKLAAFIEVQHGDNPVLCKIMEPFREVAKRVIKCESSHR